MTLNREQILIIGGGAAGMSAAAKAKRENPSLQVTVLDKNDYVSLSRCGLPRFISGDITEQELFKYPLTYFQNERGINLKMNTEVLSINRSRNSVTAKNIYTNLEEEIAYDKLIIATGAELKVPNNMTVSKSDKIFCINSYEIAKRLKVLLDSSDNLRAVVIGAGAQGISILDTLLSHNVETTLIDSRENSFAHFGVEIAEKFTESLSDKLTFINAMSVTEVFQNETSVVIKSFDREIKADLAILATGIKPQTMLAVNAGLNTKLSGEIVVDQFGMTSDFNIYAAGDCALTRCIVTGEWVYHPTATNANKTGYNCGINIAGGKNKYSGTTRTYLYKTCGNVIGSTGLSMNEVRRLGYDFIHSTVSVKNSRESTSSADLTLTLVANRKDRTILGGYLFGETTDSGTLDLLATIITARLKLDDIVNLDLAYSPEVSNVYHPVHYAARKIMAEI